MIGGCLFAGAVCGLGSLYLSIVPSFVNHTLLLHSHVLDTSYNQRIPVAVFLGVSLQGVLLAWLLSRRAHALLSSGDFSCCLLVAVFGILLPSPAILDPVYPNFPFLLSSIYMWLLGALVAYEALRQLKKRDYLSA